MKRRNFSPKFKRESAQRVVDQNYLLSDANKAMDSVKAKRQNPARLLRNKSRYVSFSEATYAITDYIMGYYSILRPHGYNGGLPPNE